MKIGYSLFAVAVLLLGVSVVGRAEAATGDSATATRAAPIAAERIPGSEFQSAMDGGPAAAATSSRSVDAPAVSSVDEVHVRDPKIPTNPDRTFQGWWKDN